jgi:hypothetical protein
MQAGHAPVYLFLASQPKTGIELPDVGNLCDDCVVSGSQLSLICIRVVSLR